MLVFLTGVGYAFSQDKKEYLTKLQNDAAKNFHDGNYSIALTDYEKIIKADSMQSNAIYYAGVCHILLKRNISLAQEYFKRIEDHTSEFPAIYFFLGETYMLMHELKTAISYFNKYIDTQDEVYATDAVRSVEMCQSGMDLMNKPQRVSFENLGATINSTMDDCFPFVSEDESFMVFASNKRYDPIYGVFDENVYLSFSEKSGWGFPVQSKDICTFDNEFPVGMTPNGKNLFVCTHNEDQFSEINVWKNKGKSFKQDDNNSLNSLLVSKKWYDGATGRDDMDFVVVSARLEDSFGGSDLYMYRKMPDGTWSKPRNLGSLVNTVYDECYPNLSFGGHTLYFASKGHNSMGGFDIFVTYYNEITGEWTNPQNMGYPINTASDNTTISFAANRKYAYISAYRKDGYGGQDIYRLNFIDQDAPLSLLKGSILVQQEGGPVKWQDDPYSLNITVYDDKENIFGNYTYNGYLNRFVSIFPKGKYKIEIQAAGYETLNESIEIMDRNLFVPEFNKEFVLLPEKL